MNEHAKYAICDLHVNFQVLFYNEKSVVLSKKLLLWPQVFLNIYDVTFLRK